MRIVYLSAALLLMISCGSPNTEQRSNQTSLLEFVTFNIAGFTTDLIRPNQKMMVNPKGDAAVLSYFEQTQTTLDDYSTIDKARNYYRKTALSQGGGIVEANMKTIDGVQAIESIIKAPQHTGMSYIGYIAIPFQKFNYVLQITCREGGITGVREAGIFLKMKLQKKVEINEETGEAKGWTNDPYDPSFTSKIMRNISDDEQYDKDFPEHPLSRLRRHFKSIESSLKIDDAIKSQTLFSNNIDR